MPLLTGLQVVLQVDRSYQEEINLLRQSHGGEYNARLSSLYRQRKEDLRRLSRERLRRLSGVHTCLSRKYDTWPHDALLIAETGRSDSPCSNQRRGHRSS